MANARVGPHPGAERGEPGAHRPQHGDGHRHQRAHPGQGHPGLRDVQLDRDTLVAEALAAAAGVPAGQVLQVDAAEATLRQNFRNFFPDIVGQRHLRRPIRDDLNEIWELGVQLNWSIFDGGNKMARSQGSKALAGRRPRPRSGTPSSTSGRKSSRRYVNVIEAEERIGAAQKAVASAQENFRLSPGSIRRRRRHHHRADRRPARPDPGPVHARPRPSPTTAIAIAAAGAGHRAAVDAEIAARAPGPSNTADEAPILWILARVCRPGGRPPGGYFYAQSRGSAPQYRTARVDARAPHRGRLRHRQPQRGDHRPGRQPGLRPDQGAAAPTSTRRSRRARSSPASTPRSSRPRSTRPRPIVASPRPPCSTSRPRSSGPGPTSRTRGRRWPRPRPRRPRPRWRSSTPSATWTARRELFQQGAHRPAATWTAAQAVLRLRAGPARREPGPGAGAGRRRSSRPRRQLAVTEAKLLSARAQVRPEEGGARGRPRSTSSTRPSARPSTAWSSRARSTWGRPWRRACRRRRCSRSRRT